MTMQQDHRRASAPVPGSKRYVTQVHVIKTETIKHEADATVPPGSQQRQRSRSGAAPSATEEPGAWWWPAVRRSTVVAVLIGGLVLAGKLVPEPDPLAFMDDACPEAPKYSWSSPASRSSGRS